MPKNCTNAIRYRKNREYVIFNLLKIRAKTDAIPKHTGNKIDINSNQNKNIPTIEKFNTLFMNFDRFDVGCVLFMAPSSDL